jgi:hypothetical protein
MLANLSFCVDLFQITYYAVNGMKGLSASVADLQQKLADNLILSNENIQRTCYKTDSIIGKFLDAYGYLLSGNEDIALEILGDVKEDATTMRQDAEKLAAKFTDVANKTENVLTETIELGTQNYEKRDAVVAESRRVADEAAVFEMLKRNLEEGIRGLNMEYNAFQKQQAQTEERAFALQLAGVLLGGLGMTAQSAKEMQNIPNQNALQEYAKKYDAYLAEISTLRKKLEQRERESLMKLAENTKKIANTAIDKDPLETATASLIVAIGCLRKEASHLRDMVAFWNSIENCCESLAKGDIAKSAMHLLKKYRALYSTNEILAQRVQPYKEIGFMRVFLGCQVRWVALGEICKEYLDELQLTRSRLNAAIREDGRGREDRWAQISVLVGSLHNKVNSQLSKTN